jgi:2-polyprenyl-3-methyl-5-hydroxy-6-metoxy-1,4-benzoquinol methylase
MTSLVVESPQALQRVYDLAIVVSGTASAPVSAWSGTQLLGETRTIGRNGKFRLLARLNPPVKSEMRVTLAIRSDNKTVELPLVLVPAQLEQRAYGEVVPPHRSEVLHRENVYGSGPPVEHPSEEALALVLQFLEPGASVLDVGCGGGAFGPPLIAAGHRWLGVETDLRCAEILQRRQLPFHQVRPGDALPFAADEFEAAIAIEVLEHIPQLDRAIAEIARVTRSRFLVSVPNMEVIPYFAPLGVVPWHLLEATHVNFFTRTSLRTALARHFSDVEVFSYGEHPVRTADNIPLHLHLFAVTHH